LLKREEQGEKADGTAGDNRKLAQIRPPVLGCSTTVTHKAG